MWTILIFIVIGMVAGWAASLLIRREKYPTDWGVLFIIGIFRLAHRRHHRQPDHGQRLQDRARRHHRLHRRRLFLLWLYTRGQNRKTEKQQVRRTANADGTHRERKGGKKHHSKR